MQSQATTVPEAIVILMAGWLEGKLVIETTCPNYDHYRTLPQVVSYQGIECGKTGWSSDTNRACYKSGAHVAHKVR